MKNKGQLFCFILAVMAFISAAHAQTTSAASGNWSSGSTWVGGVVPTGGDIVIANGHTVIIDKNISVTNLTVGGGTSGMLTFDGTTNREVVIAGNLTVAAGGSFVVSVPVNATGDVTAASNVITNVSSTAGIAALWNITGTGIAAGSTVSAFTANSVTMSLAATATGTAVPLMFSPAVKDSIYIGGNVTNNGVFDMSLGTSGTICNVIFNKTNGDQTVSGTGTMTRFRGITLAKGAVANKVVCNTNVMMAGTAITYVAGTWEQNAGRIFCTAGSVNVGSLTATAAALNIIGSAGLQIASNLNVYGSFLLNTTDSLIVGSGTGKIDLTYVLNASATFTKGTVMVYGKIASAALTKTTFDGANVIIDPKGFATALVPSTDYSFRQTTGSGGVNPLTFTGGTISILNPNNTAGANPELAMSSSVAPVMSGNATFILGQGANTIASATGFRISLNSVGVLNHLTVNTGSVDVTLLTNVTVSGNLTITSCDTLKGAFVWKAGNYIFNGSGPQVTGTVMPDTVKNMTINNISGVTVSKKLTILDTLFLKSGTLSGDFTARVTVTGGTAVRSGNAETPQNYSLKQNYPNPFNPSTAIVYQLPLNGHVSLRVFDAIGKEVAELVNERQEAGEYTVQFDASGLSSGMYVAIMRAGGTIEMKKMMLLK
jgi:hydroxyethylthiazole kinase-like sugar kinase family protein